MGVTQMELLPRPTVAQVVYKEWLWQMHNMSPSRYHPVTAMKRTAEYFDLPYELVKRIVHIQSRWEARRTLRNIKDWKETVKLVNKNRKLNRGAK